MGWVRGLAAMVAALALACGATSSPSRAEDASSAPPPPTAEQISAWVRDLDADAFAQREAATAGLAAAGKAAIEPLGKLDFGVQNLEVIARSMYILQELAASSDQATGDAAYAVLERISASASGPAQQSAAASLRLMNELRQERAIVELQRLGVKVGVESRQVGPVLIVPNLATVVIDSTFRGRPADLKRLKFLGDAQLIELAGERINDEALAHVAAMQNLEYVIIKRTKVTSRSVSALRNLPKLRNLTVMYSPLDDSAVEDLSQMKTLSELRLFGTDMTRGGSERVAAALGVKVDYREGAFLGISCEKTTGGCVVTLVHPESSAARAGLAPGDVIAKIGDDPVPDFEALTALIAGHKPGDKLAFHLLRQQGTDTVEVTLGSWE